MKANWEEIATNLLAEHVGVLAVLIVEDALAKVKSSPNQPTLFLPEFILRVARELPEPLNRAQISVALREALK